MIFANDAIGSGECMIKSQPQKAAAEWWEQHRPILVLALSMWVAATVAASILPGAAITAVPARSDKAGHAVLYGILAVLLRLVSATRPARHAVMAACGFGTFLEVLQFRVPGRTADLMDVFWNCVGSLIGAAVAGWMMSPRRTPLRPPQLTR